MEPYETLLMSDVQLGIKISRAEEFLKTLRNIRRSRDFKTLVLLGDLTHEPEIFGRPEFQKFPNLPFFARSHRRALRYLWALAKRGYRVIWVPGNHDPDIGGVKDIVAPIEVTDEYEWECGGQKYLALHGHQFEGMLQTRRRLVRMFVVFVRRLGAAFSRWVPRRIARKVIGWVMSRHHGSVVREIPPKAIRYALSKNAQHVICGHTHDPILNHSVPGYENVRYHNTGCWESRPPGSYITVNPDGIRLHYE